MHEVIQQLVAVEAEAQKLLNEAENVLTDEARYSLFRRKLLDRMIAAQALVHRATLVTRNAADFRDVPGLSILEW